MPGLGTVASGDRERELIHERALADAGIARPATLSEHGSRKPSTNAWDTCLGSRRTRSASSGPL